MPPRRRLAAWHDDKDEGRFGVALCNSFAAPAWLGIHTALSGTSRRRTMPAPVSSPLRTCHKSGANLTKALIGRVAEQCRFDFEFEHFQSVVRRPLVAD